MSSLEWMLVGARHHHSMLVMTLFYEAFKRLNHTQTGSEYMATKLLKHTILDSIQKQIDSENVLYLFDKSY